MLKQHLARASCQASCAPCRVPQPSRQVRPAALPTEDVASTSGLDHSIATMSRRAALASAALMLAAPGTAQAVGFKKELKKRKLTPEDYLENDEVGLRTYELEEGKAGDVIKEGDRVTVHYDCLYRGLDVVSSRSARLLGGNRTIAEPYEFVAGETVLGVGIKKINEGANGLFAGQGGPKPPQALSKAVLGMKKGGKRIVLVDDPNLGYPKGELEIPAGATFELKVEVLEVISRQA